MPDYWLSITHMGTRLGKISVPNYLQMLAHVPSGSSEFVAHPAYIDDDLKKWSTYLEQRVQERTVLLNEDFRKALLSGPVGLGGYRDIPAGRA